jgi:hypothetical protein
MTALDTLIRLDTLTFVQALGLADKLIEEVKTQHVYNEGYLGKGAEAARAHRLLRGEQPGRR